MNENINFYKFMHKQILVVIILFVGTGPGYLLMGYISSSLYVEILWFMLVLLTSFIGFRLYKSYDEEMSVVEKDVWLDKVRLFMFGYFLLKSLISG